MGIGLLGIMLESLVSKQRGELLSKTCRWCHAAVSEDLNRHVASSNLRSALSSASMEDVQELESDSAPDVSTEELQRRDAIT